MEKAQQPPVDSKTEESDVPDISLEYDRHFMSWMLENRCGIILGAYKSNTIISLGATRNREDKPIMSLWLTDEARPMSLCDHDGSIWVGSMMTLKRYAKHPYPVMEENVAGVTPFDANYFPREIHVLNDIDMHDLRVNDEGKQFFVSALYSCVGVLSKRGSFKVYWQPPWISKIAAEDRCHLNGLCLDEGTPRWVTTVSQTDIAGGWRNKNKTGGVVYDIKEDRVVCRGLSMPHSPRMYRGKLWVLDSGRGWFGWVDFNTTLEDGTHPFKREVFLPSYLRGLSFHKHFAVIGGSQDRHDKAFAHLELGETLQRDELEATCGLYIINMNTMDNIHHLSFSSYFTEMYDVLVVPNTRRPRLIEGSAPTRYDVELQDGTISCNWNTPDQTE